MAEQQQWLRKASLVLVAGDKGLDLSELHFRFKTNQTDLESPNNCSIRVYNLSQDTIKQIRGEFSEVVLQAGYEASYGVIFRGTVKQYRIGRESATDTYLDILAADGDLGYNFGVVNQTLGAGSSPPERYKAIVGAMSDKGLSPGYITESTGGVLPRGKVLFGMGRDLLRNHATSQGATWSIDDGKINVIPLVGYLPGEAVVLNSLTGLVGTPEQTAEGLRVRCLLNPKIVVGGRIQIDNKSVNQTVQQNPNAAPVPYNQWTGIQLLATITADGFYRVYVAEHEGDTRGQAWYSDLVCLAVEQASGQVKPYG